VLNAGRPGRAAAEGFSQEMPSAHWIGPEVVCCVQGGEDS